MAADERVFQPSPDELDVFYFRSEITNWPSLLFIAVLIIPAPLFLGGVFPLLMSMASPAGHQLPPQTGKLYLANSVGAFAAAVFTQLIGFRVLGSRTTLTVTCLLAAGAGVWCLVRARGNARRWVAAAVIAPCVALFAIPDSTWLTYTYGRYAARFPRANLDLVEGETGTALIAWGPTDRSPRSRSMAR